jgi:hypothetical protein
MTVFTVSLGRPWLQLASDTDADVKLIDRHKAALGDDPAVNLSVMLDLYERFQKGLVEVAPDADAD